MICLSRGLVAKIFRYLESHYPEEACGLLYGARGELDVLTWAPEVENINKERAADRYEMSPLGMLWIDKDAAKHGYGKWLGVYHSHPDHPAKPSATDLERAQPDLTYMIVSIRDGHAAEWTCWMLNEEQSAFIPQIVRLVDEVE